MASIERLDVGKRMSEASKYAGIIHLAGQVAEDDSADIGGQTAQVLTQVDKLLARAGSDKSQILMMQIYLKDISQFAVRPQGRLVCVPCVAAHSKPQAMNAVYDTWVPAGHTSPRATVQAALADPKWLASCVQGFESQVLAHPPTRRSKSSSPPPRLPLRHCKDIKRCHWNI
jgi:enamine deaminase RidA (YjgF/YER057c/UK114 family)